MIVRCHRTTINNDDIIVWAQESFKHYKTQRQSYTNRKEVERVAGLTWTAHISIRWDRQRLLLLRMLTHTHLPDHLLTNLYRGARTGQRVIGYPQWYLHWLPPPSWASPVCPHRLRGDTHQSKPDVTEKVSLNQNQWYALVRPVLFCSTHTSTVVFFKTLWFSCLLVEEMWLCSLITCTVPFFERFQIFVIFFHSRSVE